MIFRRFFAASGALLYFCAWAASAHAPFDCSARVIVHADTVEVMVTAGAGLAEKYFQAAAVNPPSLGGTGRPKPLPVTMAAGFFEVAADGKRLTPRLVDLAGNGVEFQFRSVYPLPPAKSLRLDAKFLPQLPSPRNAALVVCDENNNILGTAILSPQKDTAEFGLPAALFGTVAETNVPASSPNPSLQTPAPTPSAIVQRPGFREFFSLGLQHILTGYDHLLFLFALLLGCRRLKPMLLVITGFTLAHSVTLALAALNVVTVSSRVVEPLIALSIMFVAAENLRRAGRNEDGGLKLESSVNRSGYPLSSILNLRRPDAQRYALTCGFGLIHGFGFAGALRATGLAANGAELAVPLFAFNLGVETGQLAVAAVVLPLLFLLQPWPWFQRFGAKLISAAVILVAAFWFWQRLV